MLKIGDRMPSFEVLDQDGATVRSEDFIGKGRKTIIYFYPKDNTSGCTAEACLESIPPTDTLSPLPLTS